jgi:hypothetical protein
VRTYRTPKHPQLPAKSHRRVFYGGILAVLAATVAVAGIGASLESPRSLMTRQDYSEARKTLEAQTRRTLGECRTLEGRAKEVCRAEARAADRIHRAELDARYYGTVDAESGIAVARVKAQFEVARARCNELAGDERGTCLKAARTERSRALAEARPSST